MVSQLQSLLFSLGLLLLLPAGAQPTAIQELYVKPTEDTSCPEPCHTLDEYVQHATQYFVSNTAFKFLPGTHDLGQPLNVSGISNLAMVAHSNASSVKINCSDTHKVYISFTDISNLTLEDLTFSSCSLGLTDLLNLSILRVCMDGEPPQFQSDVLSAKNILGTSSVEFSAFFPSEYVYGHILIVSFSESNFSWPLPTHNQLTIKNSDILCHQRFLLVYNIIVVDLNQSSYDVRLLLENITITYEGGIGFLGLRHYGLPALKVSIGSAAHNAITIKNISNSTAFFLQDDISTSNTIVHIVDCQYAALQFSLTSTKVAFEDSFVYYTEQYFHYPPFRATGHGRGITIRNVTFSDLQPLYYSPRFDLRPSAADGLIQISKGSNVSFIKCKFLNNNSRKGTSLQQQSLILLANTRDISFTNCEFSNNVGTAISSLNSCYTLSGSNTFSNNSAYKGGAMAFYGQSYVTFSDSSSTLFEYNSADTVGGAIYVNNELNSQCFFQGNICSTREPRIQLRFEGNKAVTGGDRVYGASFDSCSVNNGCDGWKFANSLFHFDPKNTSDFSTITSDPLRVCLCVDGRPSCTKVFSSDTHYPGETFNISAVVVGDRFGTVDGSVYAHILPIASRVAELGDLQSSQRVEHSQCTNVSYTVFSNSRTVTITLTASSVQIQQYPNSNEHTYIITEIKLYNTTGAIHPFLQTFPVFITITLLPCPLGFMLSGQSHGCICDTQLQNNHIPCDLSTQTVQRSGTEWVNESFHGNSYNGVILSKYCPNNYCKPETVNVNLERPYTQCAFNHSGILCGGCQSGLSHALGSPQCLSSCSNDYLALLIPFALAGFVLVFFIKLLNLTVAQGTLNGLIFYANIVRAYHVAWMPGYKQSILTVFVAWLNLDLGIETCFFDGLDAYWMTWIQFVFPLYIWAIAILIIILSHYFSTAVKIFGSNSVPTLATLFLLSYPKLLRTIISIFQYSTLDHPDGTSETRWSYDGNISYLSPMLVPLFLAAATAVLFLWLPYTGILLFAQCLQRSSNYRVGKVLAKLKPFLDAYFGPLKDEHRYWVGVLLLVRGALFITFAATSTRNSEVAVLIALVAVLCVMLYLAYVGRVYKKSYLSLLENSFFLNLAVLAAGTLYAGKAESALAYTSVGIAFAQFVVIVIVHSIIRLKETWLARKLHQMVKPARPQAVDEVDESSRLVNEPVENRAGAQQLVVTYSNYREPVLKYLD